MNNKLISFSSVNAITSLSRSSVYRKEKAGEFPKRITFSNRCVRWSHEEVNQWVTLQLEGRV